jgi:tetratricopeptide (TPR) repeat protein
VPNCKPWAESLRKYIATGQHDFFAEGVSLCDDRKLKRTLISIREKWQDASEKMISFVTEYQTRNQMAESGVLYLLMMNIVMEHLPDCSEEVLSGCQIGIDYSRRLGFTDCEASFLLTRGICVLQIDGPRDALPLLTKAADVFCSLRERIPKIYDSQYANALVNLAAARIDLLDWTSAELDLHKAVAITEPRASEDVVFRGLLAAALANLANAIEGRRDFQLALSVCDRAIAIITDLIQEVPRFEQHLAEALSNKGNLQLELALYSESLTSFRSAVDLFRKFAHSFGTINYEKLASILSNMSNAYQQLRRFTEARTVLE